MRPRWLITAMICALLALFAFILFPRHHEPRYKGRTITQWVDRYIDESGKSGVSRFQQIGGQYIRSSTPNGLGTVQTLPVGSAPGQEAADALRAFGTNSLPYLIQWMAYQPSPLTMRLQSLVQKLPARLKSTTLAKSILNPRGQRRANAAVDCMLMLGPEAAPAVPQLMKLIANPATHPPTQTRAILALANASPQAIVPLLTCVTNKALPAIPRSMARTHMLGLQRYGSNAVLAVPMLASFLKETDPMVAEDAARALGFLGKAPEVAVTALAEALGDSRPAVRRQAMMSLGMFRAAASNAVPALLKALEDPDPMVSNSARTTLRQMVIGAQFQSDAAAAVPMLITFLKNGDATLAEQAARSLGSLRTAPELIVPALTEALGDSRAGVRRQAMMSLNMYGLYSPITTNAVPALMKALDDPDQSISTSARATLRQMAMGGRLRPEAVPDVPLLVSFLKSGDARLAEEAARSLAYLRKSEVVVPVLIEALGDSRPTVRREAMMSLGMFRGDAREALPALTKALDDPDPSISSYARATIIQIAPEKRAERR